VISVVNDLTFCEAIIYSMAGGDGKGKVREHRYSEENPKYQALFVFSVRHPSGSLYRRPPYVLTLTSAIF